MITTKNNLVIGVAAVSLAGATFVGLRTCHSSNASNTTTQSEKTTIYQKGKLSNGMEIAEELIVSFETTHSENKLVVDTGQGSDYYLTIIDPHDGKPYALSNGEKRYRLTYTFVEGEEYPIWLPYEFRKSKHYGFPLNP